MKVGCFALIEPLSSLDHQLQIIEDMGFKYADVTDSHSGGSLIDTIGMTASVSLDSNPIALKRLFEKHGITATTVCAHAKLLDPSNPSKYGVNEIWKAVKLASQMEVPYVITTEMEPDTAWGKSLSMDEGALIIAEKIHDSVELAADLGITILLEPHGPVTDTINGMEAILERCGNSSNLGVNLDTGNCWLGGSDPVEFAQHFKSRIQHIHWKDMPTEMEEQRGQIYGAAMAPVALGTGILDLPGVYSILKDTVEHSTLEVAGADAIKASYEYLKTLGAE